MRWLPLVLLAGCQPPTVTHPKPPPVVESDPETKGCFDPPGAPAASARPLSGGTLLIASDGKTAVVSDPDRDRVVLVDLVALVPLTVFALHQGDEPGRAAEDGAGRAHVLLRGGGAALTIDYRARTLVERRPVCPAPRGIAFDPSRDAIHVACAGGELVTLPAAGGAPSRTLHLDRDLRDVIVRGDSLLVSRFRSAELLTLDAAGNEIARARPPGFASKQVRDATFQPAVAWRTLGLPEGVLMIHQRGQVEPIPIQPVGAAAPLDQPTPYGPDTSFDCASGIVHATATLFAEGKYPWPEPLLPTAALPVDAAVQDGRVLLVAAGNTPDKAAQLFEFSLADGGRSDCGGVATTTLPPPFGRVIAVAAFQGGFVVQAREPSALLFLDTLDTIDLAGEHLADRGWDVFHTNSGSGLACASCHPEGGDDGRVWRFTTGPRRTQSLRGGVAGTAPFHWGGEMPDLHTLVEEVFTRRMGGPALSCGDHDALAGFLETIPLLPASPPADPAAVARGRTLFFDDTIAGGACAGCHAGDKLTNNATASVGTGEPLQVPSLRGVGFRAPFLHAGCAPTLADRFGPCGGGAAHGNASRLSAPQIADLTAFLETL